MEKISICEFSYCTENKYCLVMPYELASLTLGSKIHVISQRLLPTRGAAMNSVLLDRLPRASGCQIIFQTSFSFYETANLACDY